MSRNVTGTDVYSMKRTAALEAAAKFRRTATKKSVRSIGDHRTNNNEQTYADRNYVASFHKALPHDSNGIVDKEAFEKLVKACREGTASLFEEIPRGYTGSDYYRLVDPQGAHCLDVAGPDNWATSISRTPPIFNSAENAANMIELYGKLLCRDIPYADYSTNATVADICTELSAHAGYKGPKIGGQVTPACLFRGPSVGDLTGPYISQFMFHPVSHGIIDMNQKFKVPPAGADYMKTFATYLSVQNGHTTETAVPSVDYQTYY